MSDLVSCDSAALWCPLESDTIVQGQRCSQKHPGSQPPLVPQQNPIPAECTHTQWFVPLHLSVGIWHLDWVRPMVPSSSSEVFQRDPSLQKPGGPSHMVDLPHQVELLCIWTPLSSGSLMTWLIPLTRSLDPFETCLLMTATRQKETVKSLQFLCHRTGFVHSQWTCTTSLQPCSYAHRLVFFEKIEVRTAQAARLLLKMMK